MKEHTVLDYVEFQLSSPRSSRCELFVTAEGGTEKIASGLLKTFSLHVEAARELQGARAQPSVRLEGPHALHASRRPWFTKGTLERFVRFVSTPEVLERVKTIEDELTQLEQVRNIQACNLAQTGNASTVPNPTGVMPSDFHVGHYLYNAVRSEAEESTRELLRAMDVRLAALQHEQNMAFCRAVVAGFDDNSLEDLLAFSDYFGADRLRVACNWFCELSKRRQQRAPVQCCSSEASSQANVALPAFVNEESESGLHRKDRGGWVPDTTPSKICTSPGPPTPDELACISPVRSSQVQGNVSKVVPQRTSPRRRSASPLKKVQVGRFGSRRSGSVVIRSINYFSHDRSSKERNNMMETSGSDSEDNDKCCTANERVYATTSSPTAARRLSVQAAINIFEGKQHADIDEALGKPRSLKQENRKGSLEGSKTSSVEKVDIREYRAADNLEVNTLGSQEGPVSHQSLKLDCAGNYRLWMERIGKQSPRRCQESSYCSNSTGASSELDSEEQTCTHSASVGSVSPSLTWQKNRSSPREGCTGLSAPEEFVVSELDSVQTTPLVSRRKPILCEPVESDISSASTITSISQGGACFDKCSVPVQASFHCPPLTSSAMAVSSEVSCSQNSRGKRSTNIGEGYLSPLKNGPSTHNNEEGNITSRLKGTGNLISDVGIQVLASLAGSPALSEDTANGNEGRFYEQYRKLRDAKMMEEQQSKRAEREAKLRLMEETLELRKAEMDARTAKYKDSHHTGARAAKLLALKANFRDMQNVQEEGALKQSRNMVLRVQMKDHAMSDSSPPSPPLTPRAAKEQALTPKPYRAKKAVAALQKSATTPQNSKRAASVSPRSTPRGNVGKSSSLRSSVSSNLAENPLACSVPCFSDLKKENTKPSPGKSSGSVNMYTKNGGALGHPSATTSRASLLETNGSAPVQNTGQNKTARVDRKNRSSYTRQSYTTCELKGVSTAAEEDVSVVPNAQRDAKNEMPISTKIRRSAVAPIQEARPFLRKGTGIGPGAGPGVMKLKADLAVKSSDEEAPGTPLKNSDEEVPTIARNMSETSNRDTMTTEDQAGKSPSCLSSQKSEGKEVESESEDTTHHSDGGLISVCKEMKLGSPFKDEELTDNERACHTISFPIEFSTHKRYAAFEADSAFQRTHVDVTRRQEGESSATLSQLLSESASQGLQSETSGKGSASFRANLVSEEHTTPLFSPMKAASLASSSLKGLGATIPDYFSPSSGAMLIESPLGSPASWNSSQIQYASETDVKRAQKKWGSSEKPVVVVVPPKEPAKGFKRLLNFARKSRAAPEVFVTDSVFASSTPSEGDNDCEEVRHIHSAHDLLRKAKLQERLLKDFGSAVLGGDHSNARDKDAVQSSQNAIPIPPSNFKLRCDHVPGSSRLKAPRSFFSLSTFRSRGSEGKSR